MEQCTYDDGSFTSYESTWNADWSSYTTTNCWGDSTGNYCSECTGGYVATGMWDEKCVEIEGENELTPEAALNENIEQVEVAADLCGCQGDAIIDVRKLSNSLDLVICTFH
jgi:hypothetical protein